MPIARAVRGVGPSRHWVFATLRNVSIEKCTEGGIGGWLDVSLKSAPKEG